MPFDADKALADGHSIEAVAAYLTQSRGYASADAALRDGYTLRDIVDYLGNRPPKTTIFGQVKEVVKAIPRAAASGMETAIEGGAALLPESWEKPVVAKAHEYAQKMSPQAAPGYEDTIPTKLAEGIGSMVPFIGAGVLTGGTGLAAFAAASGAGEARQRARQAGASPEQISEATRAGILPGLTDILPINRLIGKFGKTAVTGWVSAVKHAAVTGGLEGAQEMAQNIWQNDIAKSIYKPEQDLMEGVHEGGAYGFGVGAITDLLLGMAGVHTKRASTSTTPAAPAAPTSTAPTSTAPIGQAPAPAATALQPAPTQPPTAVITARAAEAAKAKAEAAEAEAAKAEAAEAEAAKVVTPDAAVPQEGVVVTPTVTSLLLDKATIKSFGIAGEGASKLRASLVGVDILTHEGRAKLNEVFGAAKLLALDAEAFLAALPRIEPKLTTDLERGAGREGTGETVLQSGTDGKGASDVGGGGVASDINSANGTLAGKGGEQGALDAAAADLKKKADEANAAEAVKADLKKKADDANAAAEAVKAAVVPAVVPAVLPVVQTVAKVAPKVKSDAFTEEEKSKLSKRSAEGDIKASLAALETAKPKEFASHLDFLTSDSPEVQARIPKWVTPEQITLSKARNKRLEGIDSLRADTDTVNKVERLKTDISGLESEYRAALDDGYTERINALATRIEAKATQLTELSKAATKAGLKLGGKKVGGEHIRKPTGRGVRHSIGESLEPTGNTVANVTSELKSVFRNEAAFNRVVTVVQSEANIPAEYRVAGMRGVTIGNHVWLVADNIEQGHELGVVLHELGAHIGFDRIMNKEDRANLVNRIRKWAGGDDVKGQAAKIALEKGGESNDEIIAYMVEELVNRGVSPKTFSAEGNWLKRVVVLFNNALRRFGFGRDITPQELVDAAFGAAHIEVSDQEAIKGKLQVGAEHEEGLFGRQLTPNAVNTMQPMRNGYNALRKEFGLEPVTDWSKPPQEQIKNLALEDYLNASVGEGVRYSLANPAMDAAAAIAGKYFAGPSAPDNIVRSAIDSITNPDRFKRVGNATQTIRTNWADKNAPWKDLLQTLNGNATLDAMGAASAVEKLEAASKVSGISAAVLERGSFRKNSFGMWEAYDTDASYKNVLEKLNEAIGKYKATPNFKSVEKFFNLAGVARRESELIKAGKIGLGADQIKRTLTDADMKLGLEIYDTVPEIKEAFRIYDKFNTRNVDAMVTSGLIDTKTAGELKGSVGYVPWFRFSDDANGNARVFNPTQFSRGLVNLSKMRDLEGGRIEDIQINNLLDNMARLSSWMVNKSVGNDTAIDLVGIGTKLGIAKKVGSYQAVGVDPSRVTKVLRNGVESLYQFSDPAFLHAFKGHQTMLSPLVNLLSVPANLLRSAITINPVFSLAQLPQDAMRAAVESGLKNPWAIYPRVLTNFIGHMFTPTETTKRLQQFGIVGRASDIMPGEAGATSRRKFGFYDPTIGGLAGRGWDILQKIQHASDAAVREALYDLTLKEGGTEVLALKRAREIINFDTKGAGGMSSFLRQTVPFMGVSMIGLNNLYRGLVLGQRLTEGERMQTRMAILRGGLQLAALTAMYTLMVGDDDDYKKLDDNKRNRSFIIPGTGLRIPVPGDGIGFLFKVIPEQITRAVMAQGDDSGDIGSRVGRALATSFSGIMDFTGLVPVIGSPLAKLGVELKTNYSFFTGHAVVGKSQIGKAPSEQFTEGTSDAAKMAGKMLDWSPLKIDYFLRGLTGQLGAATLALTDGLLHAASGKVTPSMKAADFPLWSSFTFSDKDRGDLQDYYEMRDKISEVALTYRAFIAAGQGKEAVEYMNDPENRRMFALRKLQTKIDGGIAKFRAIRKLIINDPSATDGDEMRRRLDEVDAQQTKFLQSLNIHNLRSMAGM